MKKPIASQSLPAVIVKSLIIERGNIFEAIEDIDVEDPPGAGT